MDLAWTLSINLGIVAFLFVFFIWMWKYTLAWWLRTQRAGKAWKMQGERVVLEIKIPKVVTKSPAAMEPFIGSLNQSLGHQPDNALFATNEDRELDEKGNYKNAWFFGILRNYKWWKDDKPCTTLWQWWVMVRRKWNDKYIGGGLRGWVSLEIVSIEGQIRFFLITYGKHIDLQRNMLTSQYPGVEVVEVEDYQNGFIFNKDSEWDVYFGKWRLDKDDYLPIKTYVDYELDRNPRDEHKVDPLLTVLETMATAGKDEHFWLQILLRSTSKSNWKKEGQKKIAEMIGPKIYTKDDKEVREGLKKVGDIKSQGKGMLGLDPYEKKQVEAISRNMEKDGFDAHLRFLALKKKAPGEKRALSVSKNILTVVYAMKPFDSIGFNKFTFETITVDADYPALDPNSEYTWATKGYWWEQFLLRTGFVYEAEGQIMLPGLLRVLAYRWWKSKEWSVGLLGHIKEYWNPIETNHHLDKGFVLNTEEIATIFHIPQKIPGTSNNVIQSAKSDPPLNLPV